MEVKINNVGNDVVIVLNGRLDSINSADFEKLMEPIMTSDMASVVIDCTEFVYISSAGLRVFLKMQKAANAKKGNLRIKNLNSDIKSIFDMTGFTQLFKFES
ncbi:MAG: STAS domain-containing protein [Bacteroidales bacterium]|nr:STAS domain-containing protein [Bacteroidales bacterium]